MLEATVEKLVERLTSIELLLTSVPSRTILSPPNPTLTPSVAHLTPSRSQAFNRQSASTANQPSPAPQQPPLGPQQPSPSPQRTLPASQQPSPALQHRPSLGKSSKRKQNHVLPSSVINKENLLPVATVVEANKKLLESDSTIGTFALTLARDAFFGEDVMVRCTTYGYGDTPGLPVAELNQLKEEVRRHYPKYWNSPQEFELKWTKCTESISQACKRMRSNITKKKK